MKTSDRGVTQRRETGRRSAKKEVIAGRKRYFKASAKVGALTGSTVLRLISLFVVTVFLGRSAGADVLGSLSLLLAGAAILQSISVGGLAGAAVHRLLLDTSSSGRPLVLIISSRLILIPVTFLFGGAILVALNVADSVSVTALAVFFAGYAIGSFDVGELGKTARGHFLSIGTLRLLLIVLVAVPKLIAASQGDLAGVLIWQGIEAALWQLVLMPGSGVKLRHVPAAFCSLHSGLAQIWDLRSLWLSNVMSALAQRADLFIVGVLVGQAGVGQYSTASRPVESAVILANSLIAVTFNGLVRASLDADSYAQRCRRNSRLVATVGAMVTLALVVAGPPILLALYGPEFGEAASIIPIYAISAFFLFQRQFLSRVIIIEKAYRLSLLNNLAMLLCCLALNLVLIPIYGLFGAAMAAALSHPCSLLLSMTPSRSGRRLLALSFGSLILPLKSLGQATEKAVLERR